MKYILKVITILLLSSFPALGASITYSDKSTGSEFIAADANEIKTVVNGKQDALVSGTNIKTINGDSLLGSGDLVISIPEGTGDDLGAAEYSDVVALWTTCSGYLKSDGSCATPSEMVYPSAGNIAYTLNGTSWSSLGLDTDLSTVSASDDSVASAKATKALADLKLDAADVEEVDAYIETFMEGGALNSPYVITGKISVTSFSADHTLTDTEMGGGYVVALATSDYLLDATDTVGSSACIANNTTVDEVLSVTAPATDKFDIAGAATSTGATLESSGDLGDEICVVRINSTTWKVTKSVGTWGEI